MIQKPNNSFLSGLDFIIVIAVFALGIAFTGILLPTPRTKIDSSNPQIGTPLPYTDTSSDKTLQIRNIKLDATSVTSPEQQVETCDNTSRNQTQLLENYEGELEIPIVK